MTPLPTHESTTIIHEDTWLARLDHKFSESTTLYARAQRDVALTTAPLGAALDRQGVFNHPANYIVALEHSFTPSLLNVAKFGLNRSPFHNPQICIFPLTIGTDNFEGLNDCKTNHEVGTTISGIDDVTWTHGKHTFKTSIEVRRVRLNQGITADNIVNFTDNLSLINNQVNNLFYRSSWWPHHLRHTFVLPYFEDEWKVNFVVNSVYELPLGPNKPFLNHDGAVGKLVGGWSLGGIGIWHTGHPPTVYLNVPSSQVPDGNTGPNQRPDVIPGVPLTVTPSVANAYELVNPPQDPDGKPDLAHGIREFVVGTGGKNHRPFGTPLLTSEVRNADTFGVLKLTLHSKSYDWEFIPEVGKSFKDSGNGVCQ